MENRTLIFLRRIKNENGVPIRADAVGKKPFRLRRNSQSEAKKPNFDCKYTTAVV